MNTWHNVSKKEPCPICQKTDWCTVSNDGMMCVCKRVPSPYPSKSGQGWVHVLVEHPKRVFIPSAPRRPQRRLFDASTTMAGYRTEFESPPNGDIFSSLVEIGKELNLSPAVIDRLKVGRSTFHKAWAFPMLDGDAKCVGIRLREYGSSRKWSVSGSHDGLFYDPELKPRESVYNGIKGRELVVVEGATDTIAGYQLGLPTVGRSSCNTGSPQLKALCDRLKVGRVTIVTDNDAYKVRPDGTPWRPGVDGAIRLAQQVGRVYRLVTPPKKDLRDWFFSGLTAETFWLVADRQPWKLPERAPTRVRTHACVPAQAFRAREAFPLSPHTPYSPLLPRDTN